MDTNSKETKVRAFFDKPNAPRTYLEKRFGVEARAHITRKLLGELTGSSILDIGCGDGTLALQYAINENQLTFIDLSDKMLEIARQNTPDALAPNFRYLNLDFLEFIPDQPFDVVLCVGVLAHLQSLDVAINKLHRLLKPGGRCLIQFTDQNSWSAKINSLYFSLYKKIFQNPYQYSLLQFTYPEVLCSCLKNDFIVTGQYRYSILLPGMGRLPDKFLYRYQLFTLNFGWLSKYGSEVIFLLVKP